VGGARWGGGRGTRRRGLPEQETPPPGTSASGREGLAPDRPVVLSRFEPLTKGYAAFPSVSEVPSSESIQVKRCARG
jgi:hypothetical protein